MGTIGLLTGFFFGVWFQCIYIIDLCFKKCQTDFAGLEL